MDQVKILSQINKVVVYLSVILIPLWFLPVTQDFLNFQKQSLLVLLVLVGVIAWLAKAITQGEMEVKLHWLNVAALGVVIVSAVATIVSVWPYGSFWGWPQNTSDSFLTILFFALFFFLLSNTVKEIAGLVNVLVAFVASIAVAGLFTLLQLYQVFVVPLAFARTTAFNTIGSVNSVAILAAVLLPLCLVLASSLKNRIKWIFWLFVGFFLVLLLLLNLINAWWVVFVGMIVILAFSMVSLKKKMDFGWVTFPMAVLIVSLFFLFFRVSLPGAPVTPIEVSPSNGTEISIIKNMMLQNPLLGSGPATFSFDYAKYHQVNLNKTVFWGTRFISGSSEILDWFITKGILGGVAYLLLLALAIILPLKKLLKVSGDEDFGNMVMLGLVASCAGMIVAEILYFSNFTLSFSLWLIIASIAVVIPGRQKKVSLTSLPYLSIVSSFVFLAVLVVSMGLLFLGGQRYVAEVLYLRGAQDLARGQSQQGIAKVLSAAKLNPSLDIYWRDLSQIYLSEIDRIGRDTGLSEDQKKQQTQSAVTNAVATANQSIEANPVNVENWNVRGFIYRNLIGIQGADNLAIDSYTKASSLEPASPFSFTELGRVYLIQAQNFVAQNNTERKNEALNQALESLNKAVSLKGDYAPAHYLVALTYDMQGKSNEAVGKLEDTAKVAPGDIGIIFQLGVVYYQRGQWTKAQESFERANALNANYANARYMLGLTYDKQGKTQQAIDEFNKVLVLNPDNAEVKKIISNLKAGKAALSGIQVGSPPIAENPSEIKK